jgi:hypothetical protein
MHGTPGAEQLTMPMNPEQHFWFAAQRQVTFAPILFVAEHTFPAAPRRLAASASEPNDPTML